MVKIEAVTLEEAYQKAACSLKCSVTELKVEVAQSPKKGFLGLFKKSAIIVAIKEIKEKKATHLNKPEVSKKTKNDSIPTQVKTEPLKKETKENISTQKQEPKKVVKEKISYEKKKEEPKKEIIKQEKQKKKESKKQSSKEAAQAKIKAKEKEQNVLNDTIMPMSFVSTQDDEDEYDDVSNYLADYEDEADFCEETDGQGICEIVGQVQEEINTLFDLTCFKIQSIAVSVYDEETLLVEFKGDDAALLIGKEGYRYKALSYMIFNWLNTKYKVQLRLEIAEFLKNQEDSIEKYLVGVCENIEKDGRAQTKILDGVLIQIALNELRNRYPNKYIAIRSTRDGLKYIIINDYHNK